VGSRIATGKDLSRNTLGTSAVGGRGYAVGERVPLIVTLRNKPGKYQPHIGAKESAKFVARQAKLAAA
ncbi:hypothetical protein ACR4XK_12555, partial [Glaesserella parasuis]|uniref:hypothetical protein n=1 Tax=Glaesserella parasuis TaxID=738 RepID=UPI003F37CCC7